MKSKMKIIAIILIGGIFFLNACKKDEVISKPEIDLTELGYENSKIGYTGSDLHIEAEIVAEGKIETVQIEIHPEGEHGDKALNTKFHEGEWEVDTTFTEFSGLKNTEFHKHIEIALDADTGHYHFHFIVTDQEGNQTIHEEELEIKHPEDLVAPMLTITSVPTNGESFDNGDPISIVGRVTDDQALGGMYIGLVRVNQNLTNDEVNASNTITILHTHDFDSPLSHDFSASITVGAANDNNIDPKPITGDIAWQSADYYILVKCKDAFGGNWTFSALYPIVINY
jgi:hypothetical protein